MDVPPCGRNLVAARQNYEEAKGQLQQAQSAVGELSQAKQSLEGEVVMQHLKVEQEEPADMAALILMELISVTSLAISLVTYLVVEEAEAAARDR